jgi:hypothetical protein
MPQLARSCVSRSFAFRTFCMAYRLRELRPTPAPWCHPCAQEDSEHSTWLGRPQRAGLQWSRAWSGCAAFLWQLAEFFKVYSLYVGSYSER